MITPRFTLSQDNNFLIITIRAPYCNLNDLETYVEKHDFRFVCTPYYLRLNLPGNIIDDDNSSGQFLSDSGEFIFKYSKVNKDEHFEGLDFITSLLKPIKKKDLEPNIQVLSGDNDGNEWHIEQKLPEEQNLLTDFCKYGFANQKSNILRNTGKLIKFGLYIKETWLSSNLKELSRYLQPDSRYIANNFTVNLLIFLPANDASLADKNFMKLAVEFYSVFDLKNPDETSLLDRKNLRYDIESMNFSYEHFLADYFDNEMIENIIKLNNPWTKLNKETVAFNEKEKDILKDLRNKEYLINSEELKFVLCSLVDILFAYCYDKRTTDFESSCESGWTLTKLSATLSCFDAFNNELETLISSFRRSVIYPLYRNFDLCQKVLEDLKLLLNLGPVFIVKCFLNIYEIFNTSFDPRYIINDLYIKDYIIFMQKCPKSDLEEIIQNIKEIKITKEQLNLNLDKIVDTAIKGTIRGEDILEKMSRINLNTDSDSSSDSDSTESSSTDSDDETSSSDSDTTIN